MHSDTPESFYRPLADGPGASETSFFSNLAALVAAVALTAACAAAGVAEPVWLFFILAFSLLVFAVAFETAFFPRRAALLNFRVRRKLSWKRVWLREAALFATLAAVALAYWLFPMFRDKNMQLYYYPFIGVFVPLLLVAAIPYFAVMDRIDPEEEDVYVRIGRAMFTFRRTVTRFEFANYVRSWIVKAFWLSLMQPSMVEKIRVFLYYRVHDLPNAPRDWFALVVTTVFAIDLCYASAGYIMNFKLVNSHTRTAEPTLGGWVAALLCYTPFWDMLVYPYFLRYETPNDWQTLFAPGGAAWCVWAGAIVFLEAVYAAATISAGIRFSNLTYRGLWNTGPYRFTKHPAYIFKNISWWLIAVPFVVNSPAEGIKSSLLLLCVNVLYYFRARTEERHLSRYPEYVAYAEEIERRGIFRFVGRIFPFLAYRPLQSERTVARSASATLTGTTAAVGLSTSTDG